MTTAASRRASRHDPPPPDIEDPFYAIVMRTSALAGQRYFDELTRLIAELLDISCAFITEFASDARTSVRIVSCWAEGRREAAFVYELEGTPCAAVTGGTPRYYARSVRRLFPRDKHLEALAGESYLAVPLTGSDGVPVGHIGVVSTGALPHAALAESMLGFAGVRAAAEIEHRRANRFTDGVLSSLAIQLAVLDSRGRVVSVNDAWADFWGARGDANGTAGVGSNYLDIWRLASSSGGAGASDTFLGIASVLTGGMEQFTTTCAYESRTGIRWFLVNATPLRGAGGAVITQTDITPLKEAEEAIVRAEQRERAMLADLPDQVIRMTTDGRLIEGVNGNTAATFNAYRAGSGPAANLRDVLPASAAEAMLAAARMATRAHRMMFCRFSVERDGGEHAYETRLVPSSEGDVLAVVRDLTAEQWLDLAIGAQPQGSRPQQPAGARMVRQNSYGLTFREFTVLELMARGAADKEIAAQLGVSVFTVNKHVSNILRKMGASSRTEASTRTLREGLME
jgi:DNA-binding CsgD family transcriptional regulator/PAS domain-containing protein